MGTAIAERGTRRIDALEMGMAGGDLLSMMESIQTPNYGQAVIDGGRRGPGLLVQFMPNVFQQYRLGERSEVLRLALTPASEVQKVISVGTQRARRKLTKMLSVQEIIDPSDFVALLVEQAIRAGAGGGWRIDGPR